MEASDFKWLKKLEYENGYINRLYADLSLHNATHNNASTKISPAG
jgi:hypothetical protein